MGELFSIPVKSTKGVIVVSEPVPKAYLVTFTSEPDNRLTTSFLQALLLALDILATSYPRGVVITTSGIPKFYSNGLDLEHAFNTPNFFEDSFTAVMKRLLTFPMPTIALLNGHGFAGGFMLAMFHDYRLMSSSKGFLCMNELILNAPLATYMSSIFRVKLPNPNAYRTCILEAHRYTGVEAEKQGIVDGLANTLADALQFVRARNLVETGASGVYGVLRAEMYREPLGMIEDYQSRKTLADQRDNWLDKDQARAEANVAKYKKSAKL